MAFWILLIVFGALGWIVSSTLSNKFKKGYSQIPLDNGMTGKDVAQKMLHDNGIYDVKITSVDGILTDHFNQLTKQ